MANLFVGTSGFAYASWKPDFYPQKLAAKNFLNHYATQLNAVEINYTFRQLPKTAAVEKWVSASPQGFLFACKAHMRITHMLRLKESEHTELFFQALEPLRATHRLGPVLFQLPPNFKVDVERLAAFLAKLPNDLRVTFEFRNATWLVQEVYQLLKHHAVALCLAESEKLEVPQVMTAPFVYSRLRKPAYSRRDRAEIAARVREQLAAGRDAYVFFKHEESPAGALYAAELLQACA